MISNHDYAQTDKPMNAQRRKHLKKKNKEENKNFSLIEEEKKVSDKTTFIYKKLIS